VQGVSPPEPVAPSAPSTNDGRRVPFKPFRRCISLDPHTPFLQQDKGITARTASRFEAGTPHHRSSFLRGTIAVRLHDMSGQPIGYCGRRLQHDEIARWGKWRFPPRLAKAEILYNAHRALPARASGVVVVECPWGVMRLAQAGCASPVALLGTSLSTHQAHWLQAAPAVLLLLDGDQAGRHAAARIAQQLSPLTTVRSCSLPEGYDPDDLTDSQLAALVAATIPSSLNQHTYESGNRSTP
jgi:DNA primase